MHITFDRNVNNNRITPIEFQLVHTPSYIAIEVQSPDGVTSSVVITQDANGQLEVQIYASNPQDVIPHRETLRSSLESNSVPAGNAATAVQP